MTPLDLVETPKLEAHDAVAAGKRRPLQAARGLTVTVMLILGVPLFSCGAPAPLRETLMHSYGVKDPQFVRTMDRLLGPPLIHGNQVRTLVNGEEIFPAMLEAIRGARKTITLETFIYWSGDIGEQFTHALIERAREGVKVSVIIDGIGASEIDPAYISAMREAGAQVVIYRPVDFFTLDKMNYRTHRKILVVDGRIGFTGGVGIADAWQGDAHDADHWRDNHYRVEGPVVASLQAAFIDNWIEARGQILDGPDYFPDLEPVGPMFGQVFVSSPESGSASMQLMYLLSINAAEHSLYLATPYFVPDDLTLATLISARERGVVVTIILPSKLTDSEIARGASRAVWGRLLEAGVEIYEYQPTLYHTKVMVVDRLWTSVGSTNVSNRSFRLNDEANLNIYDAEFSAEQEALLREDIKVSKRVTLEAWNARPFIERVAESLASLLSSQY